MGRKILAVIVALIVAVAIMMILEMGNSMIIAPPTTEIMNDHAALCNYMANGPAKAYIVVLIGYILASFTGGFIVTKMSRQVSRGSGLPLIVGGVLTLGMVANVMMLPCQPLWFIVVGLLVFIPVTLVGHRFAR